MTAFERLKKLCDQQGISVNTLEERIGLGKNTLYAWKKKIPGGVNLQKVADYFDVSTDYLLGRTNDLEITSASIESLKKIYQGEDKKYIELIDKMQKLDEDEIQSVINIIDVMIKKK